MTIAALRRVLTEIDAQGGPGAARTDRLVLPTQMGDAAAVRAWAVAHGIPCPRTGSLPRRLLEAWRAAQTTARPVPHPGSTR